MKDTDEIQEACDRAADLQHDANNNGSKYPAMTYEDGLRDALDWVCGNSDEDPTK